VEALHKSIKPVVPLHAINQSNLLGSSPLIRITLTTPELFELLFFNSFIMCSSLDEAYKHVSRIQKNKGSDTMY